MNSRSSGVPSALNWPLVSLSVLVLLVCLFYVYAAAYLAPYPGFNITPDLTIQALDPCTTEAALCQANQNTLQVGDELIQIGGLSAEVFQRDRGRVPFAGYDPGEAIPITFRRASEEQTIDWHFVGPTGATRMRRLAISLLLFFPFWLASSVILLLVRPHDSRWRLMFSFDYLAAIWLVAGVHSNLRMAYASPVQHALAWLLVLVYLHLHLDIPSPLLGRHWRYLLPPLYAAAVVLALLELFQVMPSTALNLGLLLAFLGSLGLMVFRLLARSHAPDRLTTGLILVGIGLAGTPAIALWVVPALLGISPLRGSLTLYATAFAIPLLPFFFLYATFKRRLGILEFRANRLLGLYGFLLLYVTAFILVFLIASHWLGPPGESVIFDLVVSIVFVVAAMPLRGWFQRQVDRLAYGAKHDPQKIVHVFASQIPATLNVETLARVLADDVAPSLLIRQSALCLLREERAAPVHMSGVGPLEVPETLEQVHHLLTGAGRYRPPSAKAHDRFDWVRLAIPIEAQRGMIGVWLFGRRDPDDYYPQRDVALLTTLARQVAVTVENARLYEQAQREIAERRRAEEALEEREERLRLVVQNMPVMLDALDEDNNIIAWNQECERVTGYSAEEITGNPRALELLYPDAGYLQRVLAEWGQRGDFRDWELDLGCKDGGVKTVAWSNISGQYPIPGWASWAIGMDVTERKRAETALKESEETARAILNAAAESMILIDDQMTILALNQTAAQRFGRSVDELVGLNPADFPPELMPPALAESRMAQIRQVIRSGKPARFEDERAGIVFDTSIYPIFTQGKVRRLAIFAQDITARRQAEQQAIRAERLAAMGQLAAALAHEVNNPLQAIRGNLELLTTFRLEQEEHKRRLSDALQEIDRLSDLTRRVLDFARPAPDSYSPVSVAHLVQRALALITKQLQIAHIHVTTDIPAGLPSIFAAPEQIVQVLLNLTINAIEAMPDGGHLHIRAAADGDIIALSLTNDGPHFPAEHIKHIFDPFFTTKPGGMGLGLSISHGIVQQHGGTIVVENLEGEGGVTFTVTLPIDRLSGEQETAA